MNQWHAMSMINLIRSSVKGEDRKEQKMQKDDKKQKRKDSKKKGVQRKDKLNKKEEMEIGAEKKRK